MRAHLVDGRLIEPGSLLAAEARRSQLAHEIGGVEAALEDTSRERRYKSRREYALWRSKTTGGLRWLKEELRQLDLWIAARKEELRQLDLWIAARKVDDAQVSVAKDEPPVEDFWNT